MTSEEIRKLQKETATRIEQCKDPDALQLAAAANIMFAGFEIAYQLAVMNERETAQLTSQEVNKPAKVQRFADMQIADR